MKAAERVRVHVEIERENKQKLTQWKGRMKEMVTKIIYNKYSVSGCFVGEREYFPKDRQDYDRVMAVIEENPDEYELVNCEYGFSFAG